MRLEDAPASFATALDGAWPSYWTPQWQLADLAPGDAHFTPCYSFYRGSVTLVILQIPLRQYVLPA